MFTLPIMVFFITLHYVFPNKEDPTAWAGGAAILMTNLVIAGYVYAAFTEEDTVNVDARGDGDRAGPRTGAFKERTD